MKAGLQMKLLKYLLPVPKNHLLFPTILSKLVQIEMTFA